MKKEMKKEFRGVDDSCSRAIVGISSEDRDVLDMLQKYEVARAGYRISLSAIMHVALEEMADSRLGRKPKKLKK